VSEAEKLINLLQKEVDKLEGLNSPFAITSRGVDPYGTGETRPPNIWTGGHDHECPPPIFLK